MKSRCTFVTLVSLVKVLVLFHAKERHPKEAGPASHALSCGKKHVALRFDGARPQSAYVQGSCVAAVVFTQKAPAPPSGRQSTT